MWLNTSSLGLSSSPSCGCLTVGWSSPPFSCLFGSPCEFFHFPLVLWLVSYELLFLLALYFLYLIYYCFFKKETVIVSGGWWRYLFRKDKYITTLHVSLYMLSNGDPCKIFNDMDEREREVRKRAGCFVRQLPHRLIFRIMRPPHHLLCELLLPLQPMRQNISFFYAQINRFYRQFIRKPIAGFCCCII